MSDDRDAQLAAGVEALRTRVHSACAAVGRNPAELAFVVVTKTFPAADVLRLAELGVQDFGENRHPEGARKAAECAEAGAADLRWHFVGAVQTNKAAGVAAYASLVHAVDRVKLVRALQQGARRAGREVSCLVQVSLDPPPAGHRSGVAPGDVAEVADAVTAADGLRLRGVMGIAPLGADPAPAFARLADAAALVRASHPDADVMSAGMSDDLEQAVAAGATLLRVGRAVLGERPALR